jgi:hypothetical protein
MAAGRNIAATGLKRTKESRDKSTERGSRGVVSDAGGQALRMVYVTKAPCGDTVDALKRPTK